jgi:hypothetical protein
MLVFMLAIAAVTLGNTAHGSPITAHVLRLTSYVPEVILPDTTADLVGTWDGLFNSPAMGQGAMKLVVSKRADYKATVTISRDESMSAEATNFKVQGNELSWTLDLHGNACDSTAVIEGSVLKGETACGGQVMFTFELRKIS